MAGSQHFSSGDIQFQLVYDRGQCADSSYLKRFYDLESLEVKDDNEGSVYSNFVKGMARKKGRYEVCLPWRENTPTLPSNYDVCVSRLDSLVKRLEHEPGVFQQYDEVIQKQIEDNIEVVDPEHDDVSEEKTHYLTHHCVLRNEAVSSKLRIVYNGSLRVGNNPSLNNCLHSGPSLIPQDF